MRRHWLIAVALTLLTANLGAENWPPAVGWPPPVPQTSSAAISPS